MTAFFAAAFSYPTVVFTVLLIFFVLYAAATLLGAADIEWLDGVFGVDEVNDSSLEGTLDSLGVTGIPLTIFGGVATVISWLGSFAAMYFLGTTNVLVSTLVGVGAGFAGLFFGALALRPMRRLFTTPAAPLRSALVGKICTIRSLRVDDASGTAEVEETVFVAEVRCFRENELTLGSKAIVYDYDSDQGIYHVGPIDPSIAN